MSIWEYDGMKMDHQNQQNLHSHMLSGVYAGVFFGATLWKIVELLSPQWTSDRSFELQQPVGFFKYVHEDASPASSDFFCGWPIFHEWYG